MPRALCLGESWVGVGQEQRPGAPPYLHFPWSPWVSATSQSWHGVGGRQQGEGAALGKCPPSRALVPASPGDLLGERILGKGCRPDRFFQTQRDRLGSQPTSLIAGFSVCPELALAQGSGGSGSPENCLGRVEAVPAHPHPPPSPADTFFFSQPTAADSTGSSQGWHCCSCSQPGNRGQCPSWTHPGQFSRPLHPVSSYSVRCLVLPHPVFLFSRYPGEPSLCDPKPGSQHSVPTGLRDRWSAGLCLEGLQSRELVSRGAGIPYKAGETRSRHCVKPTRDPAPPY